MNSRFFHATTSVRKRRNSITTLHNAEGQWCTISAEMDGFISNYFSKLFTSDGCQNDEILYCVETKVTTEQNNLLLEPFSASEFKPTLFRNASG